MSCQTPNRFAFLRTMSLNAVSWRRFQDSKLNIIKFPLRRETEAATERTAASELMTAFYIGMNESTLGLAGKWKEILNQKTGDAAGPGEMRVRARP